MKLRTKAAIFIILFALLCLLFTIPVGAQGTASAVWVGPGTAQITWSGGSLWRIADGRETWIAGPSPVTLSDGADFAYAPRPGDRYEVRDVGTGAVVASAVLGSEPHWHRVTLVLVVR